MTKRSEPTPGPWEWDSDGRIYRAPDAPGYPAEEDMPDPHVAKANPELPEMLANARLIAAARAVLRGD